MMRVMICFSLKIQLVTSTSTRERKGLNYLWLQAEEAEERVLLHPGLHSSGRALPLGGFRC